MVLYQDTVIVLLEQLGGGTIQAWDKRTGETRWLQYRDKDKCGQCNTTPLMINVRGRPRWYSSLRRSSSPWTPPTANPSGGALPPMGLPHRPFTAAA